MGMTKKHRDVLISNRSYLVKNLKFTGLFSAVMREGNILTEDFEEQIKSKPTNTERNGEFLNILATRGPYAYDQFIRALTESDQTEIIRKIEPDPWPNYDVLSIKDKIVSKGTQLVDENYLKKNILFYNRSHLESQYPKGHDQKGRVAIINIHNFENESARNGSEKDLDNLCKMFELMKYDINNIDKHGDNITKEVIMEFLKEEQNYMDTNGFKYFVWIIVIMSHGQNRHFISSDGGEISFDDVLLKFDGHNCKGLVFVPKVFIVQCCRGDIKSQGVHGARTSMTSSNSAYKSDAVVYRMSSKLPVVHEKADCFEAYCTLEGYTSWRLTALGSWFIRTIVYIFSRFSRHEDVQSMITKVVEVVSGLKTDDNYIQQPIIVTSLGKKLYLI